MKIKTRNAKQATGGRKPLWKLGWMMAASKDARRFLNGDQVAHVIQQFDDLACEVNPRTSQTQDVKPIEDYYELRDKGGILGRINVRVYFTVIDDVKLIVALHCYKKEADGATPKFVKINVRRRLKEAKRLMKGGLR